jgi:hypothetical protein
LSAEERRPEVLLELLNSGMMHKAVFIAPSIVLKRKNPGRANRSDMVKYNCPCLKLKLVLFWLKRTCNSVSNSYRR